MIMLLASEVEKIKKMLKYAFNNLINNDDDLIHLDSECEVLEYSRDSQEMERKLHEVCINHRLAVYLENYIKDNFTEMYKVDIEYNRYYKNKKHLNINGVNDVVRPDIIVHTRTEIPIYAQHYLVIEAKKDIKSNCDEDVVKSFLVDPKYSYEFGLTVQYNNFNPIKARLFYKDNDSVVREDLEYYK